MSGLSIERTAMKVDATKNGWWLCIPLGLISGCLATEQDIESSEIEDVMAPRVEALLAECGSEFGTCAPTLWPNGRIPFTRSGTWTAAQTADLDAAMADWESKTGGLIDFVPRTTETDYARFVSGGCQSGFGKVGVGAQDVKLKGCGAAVMRHELGHLLGLPHQHLRSDRDRYVQVREAMYCTPPDPPTNHCTDPAQPYCGWPSYEAYRQQLIGDSIRKCSNGDGSDYGGYDFASILQYGSDFPIGCSAAAPANCGLLRRNGTLITGNTTVSAGDASAVLEMYREREGWRRLRPVFRSDPGSTAPLDTRLTSTVSMSGSPALSRWGSSGIAAVARGTNNHYYVKFNTTGSAAWPTGSWLDLGGDLVSEPAVVSWGSGRLDVVGVGSDGYVWHKPMSNNVWGSWGSIGRPGSSTPSAPAIASWGADRLDIFVRSGTNLHQKSWTASGWSSWANRGCCITGKPSAVSWGTNRIDVVATGSDGAAWHLAYNGSWGTWGSLGGNVAPGTSPAITSMGSNRLNVYVKGDNGRLWHKSWTSPAWTGWTDIGGLPSGSPAAVTTSAGRAHVAVNIHNGSFSGMWHRYWN
jgi:hypothetical protein